MFFRRFACRLTGVRRGAATSVATGPLGVHRMPLVTVADRLPLSTRRSRRAPDGGEAAGPSVDPTFVIIATTVAQRSQADAVAAKGYHCSVCKKSFRLEMAAQLHMKQAHNGQGTVEAGPGPGMDPAAATANNTMPQHHATGHHRPAAAPIGSMGRPPAVPVSVSSTAPGVSNAAAPPSDDGDFRPVRRQRATPAPLNKPVIDVPKEAMAAMLAVWDKLGNARLPHHFVSSASVVTAYAAPPPEQQKTYQDVIVADSPNPFASVAGIVGVEAPPSFADDADGGNPDSGTSAAEEAEGSTATVESTPAAAAGQPLPPAANGATPPVKATPAQCVAFQLATPGPSPLPFSPPATMSPILAGLQAAARTANKKLQSAVNLTATPAAPTSMAPVDADATDGSVPPSFGGDDDVDGGNPAAADSGQSVDDARDGVASFSGGFADMPTGELASSPSEGSGAQNDGVPDPSPSGGVSPFAAASPFAAPGMQATSPFAAAAAAAPFAAPGMQAASPFGSSPVAQPAQPASPFANAVSSPELAASPFASPGTAPTAPSPFTSPGSPFVAFTPSSPTNPFGGMDLGMMGTSGSSAGGAAGVAVEPPKEYPCVTCGKIFSSEPGLIAHSKAKHNITLEAKEKPKSKRPVALPDLPPYVPTPVDLTSTVPLGEAAALESVGEWSDIELKPHGLSASNIELIGTARTVVAAFFKRDGAPAEQSDEKVVQLVVHVAATATTDEEEIMVRCFGGPLRDWVLASVAPGSTVIVKGLLKLNPKFEPLSNKYYFHPAVHVSSATGCVMALDA